MLQRINIEGYKSINQMELELRPINLLIGANGSGKSNFISFFRLVQKIFERKLRNYTMVYPADTLLYYGRKHTEVIKGAFDFGKNSYRFTLQPREDETLFILKEASVYEGSPFVHANVEESEVATSTIYRDKYLQKYFEACRVYHFHDTGSRSPLRLREVDVYNNHTLASDGGNLAAYLYWLKQEHPKTIALIERTLRSVMPLFDKFIFPSNLAGKGDTISLWWSNNIILDTLFSVKDFSDGSLRFLALSTLFLQPYLPDIIIIDEPELGLHPRAIHLLAGLIRSASRRGSQVIISTQSPALIDCFEPEDVVTVDMIEGHSVFKRQYSEDLASWLEDYTLGELWDINLIDGQPKPL